jgi:type II secretory pathway predicted ATPase ExeA
MRYQITSMDLGESVQYLRHHLALVGRTDPLIADDAIARLHQASLGLPPGPEQRRHRCAHRRRQCRQGHRGR